MNFSKIISPDFALGRFLVRARLPIDLLWALVRRPSLDRLKQALMIIRLKPNYSMVKTASFFLAASQIKRLNAEEVFGDIVECGCWNGGYSAFLARVNQDTCNGIKRESWLFDSFEGLPAPTAKDGQKEQSDYFEGWNLGSQEKVHSAFNLLAVKSQPLIIKGFFECTLQGASLPATIAFMHIDGDWYESVKLCLEKFFSRVVVGGVIIVDDYFYWPGAKRAVDEFTEAHASDIAQIEFSRSGNNVTIYKR